MEIKLLQIALSNFMGGRHAVDFGQVTEISGDNATGKTRVFNAFTWCLFGKDVEDRKDYQIKTLDADNVPLPRVDASVRVLISVDGMDKTFRRTYHEKWQKRRGEDTVEFTGHETLFEVDGIPFQAGEYRKAVDAVLTEETFKMLTNPFYFAGLRWDDRREILFRIVPTASDNDIAALMPEFNNLLATMAGKPLDLYRRELAAKKKMIKDDLSQIPPRIDELRRSIPQGIDYAALDAELAKLDAEALTVDGKIKSKMSRYEAKHRENIETQEAIRQLRLRLRKIDDDEADARSRYKSNRQAKIEDLRRTLDRHITTQQFHTEHIAARRRNIEALTKDIERIRAEWNTVNDHQADTSLIKDTCIVCGQPLPEADLTDLRIRMIEKFNADKVSRLAEITRRGEHVRHNIENEEAEIKKSEAIIADNEKAAAIVQQQIDALVASPDEMPDTTTKDDPRPAIREEITALEAKITDAMPVDTSDLRAELAGINTRRDELKRQLALRQVEDTNRKRIAELELKEKTLARELADLERAEFQIDKFERARVTMIEDDINRKFTRVKFKMFNQLINGGTEPACEILINGVPFGAANRAAQINAGIDIINTLSAFYGVAAPIFVDNAEAVNDLTPTLSQLIRLVVTKEETLQTKIIA